MSDESTVIPFGPRRMSEDDYDQERQRIRDLFGDNKTEAGARWEQALAGLFFHSGWTQEELAKKEGKSQTWVQRQLRFGRFLDFLANSPNGTNRQIVAERPFREYWEQTEGSSELRRFQQVKEMTIAQERAGPARNRNALMDEIREHYSNGKWHGTDAIANRLDKPRDQVERVLAASTSRGSRKYKVERRRRGRDYQYRIFPMQTTVSTVELTERLGPLINQLKAEGCKNMATFAITLVAAIASEMQQMLDEWTK